MDENEVGCRKSKKGKINEFYKFKYPLEQAQTLIQTFHKELFCKFSHTPTKLKSFFLENLVYKIIKSRRFQNKMNGDMRKLNPKRKLIFIGI